MGRILSRAAVYVSALAVGLFFAAPLLWMFSTAFKAQAEWFSTPPRLIPDQPTLENFARLASSSFPRYFLNSAIVGAFATVPTIVVGVLSAYAVTFLNFRGRSSVVAAVLLTQLIPTAIMVLPLYTMASSIDALDSLPSLAVAYLVFTAPVATWLLHGFMVNLPIELQEAAQVDGATKLGAFVRVVLPIAAPGIVATGVYAFFSCWQEFILALTFLSSKTNSTLPIGILGFIGEHETDWGEMMAACVVITIPLFIIFAYLQRFLISGLSQGAVKG